MRTVDDEFKAVVKSSVRKIGFVCALQGERSFGASEIVGLNITRAACDGFQIGAACSDRLSLSLKATDRIQKGARINASFYVGSLKNLHPLGVFYADEVTTENGITTVTAYDKMNAKTLDMVVKWTSAGAPSFPCTQRDILNYLCARKKIACDFVCENFTVQDKPVGYTAREIIGFIAASHAANAHFDANGKLTFRHFSEADYHIDKKRCYSHAAGNDDGFTVKGILFDLGNDTKIYIDGDSSEYDEDNPEGIIECFNPFATVEIAEKVWHLLGGLTYFSADIEMPAENILELGDVFTTDGAQGMSVRSAVLEQELSVSVGGGFTERLSATAESNCNQRSTNNRVSSMENGGVKTDTAYTSKINFKDGGFDLTFTTGSGAENVNKFTITEDAAGNVTKIYNNTAKRGIDVTYDR